MANGNHFYQIGCRVNPGDEPRMFDLLLQPLEEPALSGDPALMPFLCSLCSDTIREQFAPGIPYTLFHLVMGPSHDAPVPDTSHSVFHDPSGWTISWTNPHDQEPLLNGS